MPLVDVPAVLRLTIIHPVKVNVEPEFSAIEVAEVVTVGELSFSVIVIVTDSILWHPH